jgi:hypothetical protein
MNFFRISYEVLKSSGLTVIITKYFLLHKISEQYGQKFLTFIEECSTVYQGRAINTVCRR